jgi:hypothetical protein
MHAIFFVSYCVHPISLEAKKTSKKTSGIVTIMLTENEKVKKSREHRPVNEKRSKYGPKKTSGLF